MEIKGLKDLNRRIKVREIRQTMIKQRIVEQTTKLNRIT